MQRSYQARFYNGVSSTPFTVNVTLFDDHLEIQYNDSLDNNQINVWPKNQIKEIEYASSIITLRFGDTFPYAQLEITDPEFIAEYRHHFHVSILKRLTHRKGLTWFAALLLGFASILTLCYFFLLPFLADIAAQHIPKEYEIDLGKQIYTGVLEGEDIDIAKTKTINQFFHQLKVEGDYPVEITVVKKDIVNAFALPGGGIVVYSSILDSMHGSEELAALLAHEYSHVQLKHATRGIFRNLAGYLFISLMFSDANGVANIVIENANNLRNLSYSRGMETEADQNGLNILANNHIDVMGMKKLFQQLKRENQLEVNEILSTHPDLDARIQSVEEFHKTNKQQALTNDSLNYYFEKLKKAPATIRSSNKSHVKVTLP